MSGEKRPLGTINRKYVFIVPLKTVSPLRIASGQTDYITDILILKNKQGEAFIPATSIAGVLRNEIRKLYGEKITDTIFGSVGKNEDGVQSMISIDDVVLKTSGIVSRDGVHIHEVAGTGVTREKYNFEAVEKGAEGILTMEMTIREGNEIECLRNFNIGETRGLGQCVSNRLLHPQYAKVGDIFADVAATLADMLTAGIRIGSLTAKGMGLVKSKKPVSVYLFDFKKAADALGNETEFSDADAWMKYIENGTLPGAAYVTAEQNDRGEQFPFSDFVIEAEFAIKSSLLIRDASRVSDYASADNKGTIAGVPMKSRNDYVIPGTGIKGALRGKAYKVLMALPGATVEKSKLMVERLMGWAKRDNNSDIADEGRKSRLIVDEIYFSDDGNIHEMKQPRNRIDRFTGATVKSALFFDFAVWQQNKEVPTIKMNIRINDAMHAEAGLMLLLLRELWSGNLPLGGGKNIGRGILQGLSADIYYERQYFRMEQCLPLKDNYGKIKISGRDREKNNLTDEKVQSIMQEYVTELVKEMENGQVDDNE